MITVTASIDEELIPYVDHFEVIFGSTKDVLAISLGAFFISLGSESTPTHEQFFSLLEEEKLRLAQAIADRDPQTNDNLIVEITLSGSTAEAYTACVDTLKMGPDEVVLMGILSLSVIEDILECDPQASFSLENELIPFQSFFQEETLAHQVVH